MISYSKVIFSLLFLLTINLSLASTLQEYIDDKCSRNCVNAITLVSAIEEATFQSAIDKNIILAIVAVESSFNYKARNRKNVGLTQVNLRYHRSKFRSKNYLDVRDNIRVGTGIFISCYKKSNSTKRALRCYNGNGDPKYVPKILKALKSINQLEGSSLP